MPMCEMCEPSGPIENGTTYIVRPRMQPSNSAGVPSAWPFCSRSRIAAGSIQLLVGPASSLLVAADEGAVLDAGHVAWVGAGQEGVRALDRVELAEGAGVDQLLAQAGVFLVRPVTPDHPGGLGQCGHPAHPGQQALVADIRGVRQGGSPASAIAFMKRLQRLKNRLSKGNGRNRRTPGSGNSAHFEKMTGPSRSATACSTTLQRSPTQTAGRGCRHQAHMPRVRGHAPAGWQRPILGMRGTVTFALPSKDMQNRH
jgi:hypothetical protein